MWQKMTKRKLSYYPLFAAILMFLAYGCSSHKTRQPPKRFQKLKHFIVYPFKSHPEYSIKFQKGQTFGSKQDVTGNPRGVAVDKQSRVFIGDSNELTIHVYSPNGRLITNLGRKGKGPGEFQTIAPIKCDSTQLFVYDFNQRRVDVFSLKSLKYSHTISLADNRNKYKSLKGSFPGYVYFRSDGKFIVPFLKIVQTKKLDSQYSRDTYIERYYLLNQQGNVVSRQLMKLKSSVSFSFISRIGLSLPFYGRQFLVISGKNNIYTSSPSDFLIKIYSPDGTYQRAFYYPYKKDALTKAELDSIKTLKEHSDPRGFLGGLYTHLFHLIHPPDTWPVINDMLMDDHNRLWVATIVKNQKVYEWWVLTNNGKLLARFTWPRNRQIQLIKNDAVYAKEKNKNGLPRIVRYKFKLKSL